MKFLRKSIKPALGVFAAALMVLPATAFAGKAYLEITLKVDTKDRPAAGAIYAKFKQQFLRDVPGAVSKELLMRDDDVQVLHGFATREQAEAYLGSDLFTKHVVVGLKPLVQTDPEVRIYSTE